MNATTDDPFTSLAEGLTVIQSRTGDRRLFQYLVHEGDDALLFDCGEAQTPDRAILPAFAELGIDADRLRFIVISHPDVDHQGGLSALRRFAPDAIVVAGRRDVPLVADPDLMIEHRYRAYAREHLLDFSISDLAAIRENCGTATAVDAAVSGGEELRVGTRRLVIVPVPGHSPGHVALWDRERAILLCADAAHGCFSPAVDGRPSLPPTYEDVDEYLDTLERLADLGCRQAGSGHLPPMDGDAFASYLEESRLMVERLDALLLSELDAPRTLEELCESAVEHFGPFSAESFYFMFAVHGHLRRFVAEELVRLCDLNEMPRRYIRVRERRQ